MIVETNPAQLLHYLGVKRFYVKGRILIIFNLILQRDKLELLDNLTDLYRVVINDLYIDDTYMLTKFKNKLEISNLFVNNCRVVDILPIIPNVLEIGPNTTVKVNTNLYSNEKMVLNSCVLGIKEVSSKNIEVVNSRLNKLTLDSKSIVLYNCSGVCVLKDKELDSLEVLGKDLIILQACTRIKKLRVPDKEFLNKYFKNVKVLKLILG